MEWPNASTCFCFAAGRAGRQGEGEEEGEDNGKRILALPDRIGRIRSYFLRTLFANLSE